METFRIGPVFRRSLSITSRHLATFAALGLTAYSPYLLLALAQRSLPTEVSEPSWDFELLNLVLAQLLVGAISYAVVIDRKGNRASLLKCAQVALAQMFPIVAAGLIASVGLLAFTLHPLFIVPGLFVTTLLYVAVPVIVAEQVGIRESLLRSAAMTRGRRWKVLGILIGLGLLMLLGAQLLEVLFGSQEPPLDPGYVIGLLSMQLVLGVYGAAVAGVTYTELRRTQL